MFIHSPLTVMCISESWLSEVHSDSMISMEGFNIVRNDRSRKDRRSTSGGVCIYLKNTLKYVVTHKSNNESNIEYLIIEINISQLKTVTVGVIYNPPDNKNVSEITSLLESIADNPSEIILTGDFNINMLNKSKTVKDLTLDWQSAGFTTINKNYPTHFKPNCNPSCLDLIVINTPDKVKLYDQVGLPFSHHDLIFISYDIPVEKLKPEGEVIYRNYARIDNEKLLDDLPNYPWNTIFDLPNIDDQLELFENILNSLIEKHVPLTKINHTKHKPPPLSDGLQHLMIDRDLAHRKWRRSGTNKDWAAFVELRDAAAALEKNEIFDRHKTLFNSDLDSKTLWRNIKQLGINDNESKSNVIFTSNNLNQHFTVAGTGLPLPSQSPLLDGKFSFRCVHDGETLLALSSVKSNAIGHNNQSPKILKLIMLQILPVITHIFNTILTKSIFPKEWKIARVIPIPKIATPKAPSDYRPISILPYLSKVFERILANQTNDYITQDDLLYNLQSGFRRDHSTTTALLNITEELRQSLDKNHVSLLVLLDFSKAFDSVNHHKLIRKLNNNFSMSPIACKLICSYLTDRWQFVNQHNDSSEPARISRGVPQGSVYGPLLFSMYINDLPDVVSFSKCSLYADDVQLLLSGPSNDIDFLVQQLNTDLAAIHRWASNNDLKLNPTKSNYLVITPSTGVGIIPGDLNLPIFIDDTQIPRVPHAKNLGVWFDDKLNWGFHVAKLCGTVYGSIRRLWKIAWAVPEGTRVRLVRALVFPIINYACTVFSGMSKSLFQKISKAFNACIRFAYGLSRRKGTSAYVVEFLGCSLEKYFELCCTIHKLVILKSPAHLATRLIKSHSSRALKLNVIKTKKSKYDGFLFIKGVRLWNSLPIDLRRIYKPKSFRKACLQYLTNGS